MHSRRSHLTYALGTLVMGAVLFLVGPVGAEDSAGIDQSTQPHLKSWSNIILNANRRFVVLADFNNQAVLDRETGLVWEKSPGPPIFMGTVISRRPIGTMPETTVSTKPSVAGKPGDCLRLSNWPV